MIAKQTVRRFYGSDIAKDNNIMDFFHEDCILKWNSSRGYRQMNFTDIKEMVDNIKKSYHSFKYRLSHILEEDNVVTARYTVYATMIERPEKEDAIAHFISIWEVKDEKLYKGFEISMLADTSSESLNSYAEIKV